MLNLLLNTCCQIVDKTFVTLKVFVLAWMTDKYNIFVIGKYTVYWQVVSKILTFYKNIERFPNFGILQPGSNGLTLICKVLINFCFWVSSLFSKVSWFIRFFKKSICSAAIKLSIFDTTKAVFLLWYTRCCRNYNSISLIPSLALHNR